MRQSTDRSWHPPFGKIVMAGMSVAAIGVTALVPALSSPATNILSLAAIDESGTTIGFSDPYLYGLTPTQVDQQLDEMQALGVNNVRVLIPWAGVEPLQGYYDWSTVDYTVNAADARGMGVLGVLNSTPQWAVDPGVPAISGRPSSPTQYGDFAGLVAQRYAGKVGAYEIWNEPNGQVYYTPKPDAAGYTALLKAAYLQIKAADPNATVVGGVLGAVIDYGDFATNPVSFVNGIYAAGGEGYFDALSYHPYNFGTPFSQGAPLPESPLNQVTAIRNLMIANGDANKLIWASEYGEPTAVATDAQQAAFLQDMLTTWPTLGYTGPTFVHSLQDIDTNSADPEQTYGVIRSDGTLKPAAYVIAQLAAQRNATPAMAQLALAMPGATEAGAANLASLTQLAETPGAATVTSADAAAVALLATAEPTATEPVKATDPASAVDANMNAMAKAVEMQLEASADAAGKALQESVRAAAEGFQKQVAAAAATASTDTSPAAIPSTSSSQLKSLAATAPAKPERAATKADTAKADAAAPKAETAAPKADTPKAKTPKTKTTKTKATKTTKTTKTEATKAYGSKHRRAEGSERTAPKKDAAPADSQKPRHAKKS